MPQLKKIFKSFGSLEILNDFSISFMKNQINCILGPSGCGKTTILNMLAGTIQADKGNIAGLPPRISYVFQEHRLLPWKTVRKNIEFVLRDQLPADLLKERTERYLEIVEMAKFADYYPHHLSGGMKQRASLARAFSYDSELILMDEPFNSLDYKLKKNVGKAFIRLWEEDKRTVIFVTHDIDEAVELGHAIFVLSLPPVKLLRTFITDPNENKLLLKEEIIELI